MTHEELEHRSKPELIDLIRKQQAQIADLQAQLLRQAEKPNGSENVPIPADAGAPQMGRFPGAFKLVLAAAGLFACATAILIASFRPDSWVDVGTLGDFPPGSVTSTQLPEPDKQNQVVLVYLVNDETAGLLALHARDPGSNCQVAWNENTGRFGDPCGGSTYARTGEIVSGASPRGLDRYTVEVTENGDVRVDVSTRRAGPPRP